MTEERKVKFAGVGVKGANKVIEQIESRPSRALLAPQIEHPKERFHEIQVGPEDGNHIITHYVYPRQRNVSVSWAVEIATLIEAGELLPTTVHFAHCKEDGQTYLVDGYHRMAGIALAKRSMIFPVEHHWCDTMEEVHRVYARLDQGAPRTIHAAIRAVGYDDSSGLTQSQVEKVAAAANVIKHNFRQPQYTERVRSASRKLDMVDEWVYEARLFAGIIAGGNTYVCDKLWNAPNLAVALVLMRYAPEKAAEFLQPVANMACSDQSAAQAFLASIINRGSKRVSVGERSRIMANAWNAFVEQRSIRVAYSQDPGRPMDLLLTPWAGPKIKQVAGTKVTTTEQAWRDVEPAPRQEGQSCQAETSSGAS